jgi:succinoglycan biosynthesis protein ExoA
VSVIVPALNSADRLADALSSIAAQDYPNISDVVVAAGDPDTARVAREHGAVVVDNPDRTTPAALNRAIAASAGEVIVRCDAHAELPTGYVTRAVSTLIGTGADNVGGMQVPHGVRPWTRAVAAAMSSPLGAGDARYRIGGEEGRVDTVYLGVFRRATLDRLGGFDEQFARNQDYELNHRIRASGGVVWFDPELRVRYHPRRSPSALARQYFAYGGAKRQFARRHPGALRLRQLAPPLLVIALLASTLGSVWDPRFLLVPAAYGMLLLVAAALSVPKAGWGALGVPLALVLMHVAWGLGFMLPPEAAVVGQDRRLGPSEG